MALPPPSSQTRALLRSSEQHIRHIFTLIPAGICACDEKGRFTYYNRRAVELWGFEPKLNDPAVSYSASQQLFQLDGTPIPPEELPMAQAIHRGTSFRDLELLVQRRDGSTFIVSTSIDPIRDAAGNLIGAVNVFQDITARKQTENALRDSESLYRAIGESINYGIWVCDAEGRNLYASDSFLNLIGKTQEECANLGWASVLHPDDVETTLTAWQECVRTGKPWERVHRFLGVDGAWHPILARGVAIRDAAGAIVRWAGINLDISEIKTAQETNQRLAAIVESSDDAIISKDLSGIITSWNKGAEHVFGYTAQEVIGRSILLLIPEERRDEEPRILARIHAGDRVVHFDTVRVRKDGRRIHVSVSVSPVKDANGRVIGASKIARDITERSRNENQQRLLYELVSRVNRAAALPDIYEAALDAITQCYEIDRASILLMEDHTMRFQSWRGLSDAYRIAAEGHSPWASEEPAASPVWIEDVAGAALESSLHLALEQEGIRALAFIPIVLEQRLLGKLMLYFSEPRAFTTDYLRAAETIASQIAFAIERHRSEQALERLVDERTASLREAVAQMEEFSYSVSHDLRAPVRAMQGYASVLLDDYGKQLPAEGVDYLNRIIRNSARMDHLIQDILTYTRLSRREMEATPVALDKLVPEIIQQYPEMQAPRAEIIIAGPLLPVLGHEPSLVQVISNLLSNAVKFVATGVTPRIHLRSETVEGEVRLWVEDNGIGIPPEFQHRLFRMFDRLHPDKKYDGTGIGLAIVRKALERMNGRAGVESDGANGSRFWIQLPAASLS